MVDLLRRRSWWRWLLALNLLVTVAAVTISIDVTYVALSVGRQLDRDGRVMTIEGIRPGELAQVQDGVFEAVARSEIGDMSYRADQKAGRLIVIEATPDFFRVFNGEAVIGRLFAPADAYERGRGVVVLGERFWKSHFGGSAAVLNSLLLLNNMPHTVVGVAGSEFDVLGGANAFIVARHEIGGKVVGVSEASSVNVSGTIARVGPGGSATNARAYLEATLGGQRRPEPLIVRPVRQVLREQSAGVLVGAIIAVVALFFLGLSNTTVFYAAILQSRRADLATRFALGGTFARIAVGLALETVGIAVLAAMPAFAVALAILRALPVVIPPVAHFFLNAEGTRLLVIVGLSVLTFWLWMALAAVQSARRLGTSNLAAAINTRERVTRSRGTGRVQNGFLFAQFALTIVCLGIATAVVRGAIAEERTFLGFQPEDILTFGVALPPVPPPNQQVRESSVPRAAAYIARTTHFYSSALEAISSIEGVTAAGAASRLPLARTQSSQQWVDNGNPRIGLVAETIAVTGDYFRAAGITVVRGRALEPKDDRSAQRAVLVTEEVAERLWPDLDPVGRSLRVSHGEIRQIVGIVRPVVYTGHGARRRGQVYLPNAQPVHVVQNDLTFVVRGGDPRGVSTLARQRIESLSPGAVVHGLKLGSQLETAFRAPARTRSVLLLLISALAVALSAMGAVSAVLQWCLDHRDEIRIRVLIGATSRSLVHRAVRQILLLVCAGSLAGVWLGTVVATVAQAASLDIPSGVLSYAPAVAMAVAAAASTAYAAAWSITRQFFRRPAAP